MPNFVPVMVAELRAAGPRSVELLIHDDIGPNRDGRGVDSESIAKALADAGDVDTIRVSINSLGGRADHGIAIHNLLKDHPAAVTVRIDGLAASAASLIAMAGDTVEMPASAILAIHNPFTTVTGDANELRKAAGVLDRVKLSAVNIYAGKSSQPDADISAMMDAETWMSADEAKALGFCDSITSGAAASIRMNLTPFANVPVRVAALALADIPAAPQPVTSTAPDLGPDRLSLADVERYTDAFGAEQGLSWLREGRDFLECSVAYSAHIRGELEAERERHAAEIKAERAKVESNSPYSPYAGPDSTPAVAHPEPRARGLAGLIRFAASAS